MASFNQGSMQQSGGGGGGGMWTGAAAGAAGVSAVQFVQQTSKTAKVAEGIAIANLGLNVLGGNQAQGFANQAMTYANQTTASGALVAADTPLIRNAIQQLAQGLQAVNPLGYMGLQTSTQPTTSPSAAAPAATQNLGGLVLIVLALFFMMK